MDIARQGYTRVALCSLISAGFVSMCPPHCQGSLVPTLAASDLGMLFSGQPGHCPPATGPEVSTCSGAEGFNLQDSD